MENDGFIYDSFTMVSDAIKSGEIKVIENERPH